VSASIGNLRFHGKPAHIGIATVIASVHNRLMSISISIQSSLHIRSWLRLNAKYVRTGDIDAKDPRMGLEEGASRLLEDGTQVSTRSRGEFEAESLALKFRVLVGSS
jgi:hypothetical protein